MKITFEVSIEELGRLLGVEAKNDSGDSLIRPSELDNLIDIYAEDPGTTETVYGYVPIKVVNKLIKKHGGIIN